MSGACNTLPGSGDTVEAVLFGIGVLPKAELAETAGVLLCNAIAVDAFGQTGAPGIWAPGDCTFFPCRGTASVKKVFPTQFRMCPNVSE